MFSELGRFSRPLVLLAVLLPWLPTLPASADPQDDLDKIFLRSQRIVQVQATHTLAMNVPVTALAFSPDSKRFAVGYLDRGYGAIKICDVATGREEVKVPFPYYLLAWVAFSPDGKTLGASGYGDGTEDLAGFLTIYDSASWQMRRLVKFSRPTSAHFLPDSTTVVTGTAPSENDQLALWNIATGAQTALLRAKLPLLDPQTSYVSTMALAPDGKLLATGSREGTVRLWDLPTRQELAVIRASERTRGGYIYALDFSRDGQMLAIATRDPAVAIIDVLQKKVRAKFETSQGNCKCVAFSPDGKALVAAESGILKLWDAASLKERIRIWAHRDHIQHLAFSPDGKTLATTDGTRVKLWDFPELLKLQPPPEPVLSPGPQQRLEPFPKGIPSEVVPPSRRPDVG